MKQTPIIIDCDPGIDDAIALLLAITAPEELDILGVTTVFGNKPLEKTTLNARMVCELAGRSDLKIFKGCARSLFTTPADADFISTTPYHGPTGLGKAELSSPRIPPQSQHAVRFIIDTLLQTSEKVTMVLMAAHTNLACALAMEPRIKEKIEKVVVMGGTMGLGNMTPAAEYNFYCDPQATYTVFTAGLPIVMMGLDMTHQTIVTEENYPAFSQLNGPVATAVQDMLEHSFSPDVQAITGLNGKIIHDPHTIAYLLKPDLYEGRHVHVEIDISTTIMAGRSTVDWFGKRALTPNAYVVNRVDVGGFFELLTDQLRQYDTDEQRHTACIR